MSYVSTGNGGNSQQNFNNYAQQQVSNVSPTIRTTLPALVQLQNTAPLIKPGSTALLILITPRDFSDQVIRPVGMNLNGAVQNELVNIIGDPNSPSVDRQQVAQNPVLASAIMPSSDTYHRVNLAAYRMTSTFMLVINNDGNVGQMGINTTLPTREVYTGWVANGGNDVVINGVVDPNAILSITHCSKFSVTRTGGMGTAGPVGSVRIINDKDVDLLSNDQIGAINPTLPTIPTAFGAYAPEPSPGVYSLDMHDLCLQSILSNRMTTGNLGDYATMQNVSTDVTMVPRCGSDNLVTVSSTSGKSYSDQLYNLTSFSRQVVNSDIANGYRSNNLNGDVEKAAAFCSMSANNSLPSGSIDPREPIVVSELVNRFGAAFQVLTLNVPFGVSYDRVDPAGSNPQAIAASILQNAMPSLLANNGIADLTFTYDSTAMDFSTNTQGLIYWHVFAPIYPVHDTVQAATAERVAFELKNIIFPKIAMVFGHFRCHISASYVGTVLVNIQLFDHTIGSVNNGFVETNNILGGLNTSLLGTRTDLIKATQEFTPVMTDVMTAATQRLTGYSTPAYNSQWG